jgi:hypothetical protein
MGIEMVEGEELSSVTFIHEYVQFDFGGPNLTLFHWPEVFVPEGMALAEGSYAFGEPGYRDAMCSQIGESVSKTSMEMGVALEIEFESGVIFRSSLREEDYEGPEAGQFSTGIPGESLLVF